LERGELSQEGGNPKRKNFKHLKKRQEKKKEDQKTKTQKTVFG